MGITFFEVIGFRFCSPAGITIVGFLHIACSDFFFAPVEVELSGEFVREGFFVEELVFFSELNGAIVQLSSLPFFFSNTSHLRLYKQKFGQTVFRTVVCPNLKLFPILLNNLLIIFWLFLGCYPIKLQYTQRLIKTMQDRLKLPIECIRKLGRRY